jgi:M6 family metalloprotease-like protein
MVNGNTGTLDSWKLHRRKAMTKFAHDASYYQSLVFSAPQSVNGYYNEISRYQFHFDNAGIYSTTWSSWTPYNAHPSQPHGKDNDEVRQTIADLESAGFNFKAYDKNNDNIIDDSELMILEIDNVGNVGGKNRGMNDGVASPKVNGGSLTVRSRVAFLAEETDFETICHELSHTLGTVDLYADTHRSQGLTLMGGTISSSDNMDTLYLDPWHRFKLGWVFPLAVSGDSYEIGDETYTDFYGTRARPAVFYNSADPHEYYLFEYRGGRGYDRNVSDWGIVAWHVKEYADGQIYQGPNHDQTEGWAVYASGPDKLLGGSRAWHASDGNFQLKWTDGTPLPLTFWVEEPGYSYNSNILHWASAPENAGPTIDIVRPTDNSSGPIGWTLFEANVTDAQGNTDQIRVDWSSDLDDYLGSGAAIGSLIFTPGTRTVTVTARDRYGATSSKSIKYTATNVGPSPTILFPRPNATYYRNQPVQMLGFASSPVAFALGCDRLTWTIDRDPSFRQTGCFLAHPFNLVGKAVITLTASDSASPPLTGTTQVTVTFVDPDPNGPPIVTITAPEPDFAVETDTSIAVSGVITDPSGGAVTQRWTVYNKTTGQETDLSTALSFTWTPQSTVQFSTDVELRLYGTSSHGTTMAAQPGRVLEPPK